jgi:hypothetical protein
VANRKRGRLGLLLGETDGWAQVCLGARTFIAKIDTYSPPVNST